MDELLEFQITCRLSSNKRHEASMMTRKCKENLFSWTGWRYWSLSNKELFSNQIYFKISLNVVIKQHKNI